MIFKLTQGLWVINHSGDRLYNDIKHQGEGSEYYTCYGMLWASSLDFIVVFNSCISVLESNCCVGSKISD